MHVRKVAFSPFGLIALMPWERKAGEKEGVMNDDAKANNFLTYISK